jgi:hypothetical protein
VGGSTTSPQTLNRYAYTGNNPLNNVDPSGHVFFGAQFNSSQSYGNESGAGYPDYACPKMLPKLRMGARINRYSQKRYTSSLSYENPAFEKYQQHDKQAVGSKHIALFSTRDPRSYRHQASLIEVL